MTQVSISAMTATFNDASSNLVAMAMDATNIASGAGSKILDLKTNGVSMASVGVDGTIRDVDGDVRILPINDQSAVYTLAISDVGKVISITTGGVLVPNTIFTGGDAVTVYNNSAVSQSITNNGGVMMRLAGTATVGTRALAQYGMATILCVSANTFVVSGAGLT